jgi:RimJ/RimL family protein N-acetyltransferase
MVNSTGSSYSLCPIAESDLGWFVNTRNSCVEFLHDPREFTVFQAQDWWAHRKDDYRKILFNEEAIGYFRIGGIETRKSKKLLWVGADLARPHQSAGHGKKIYEEFLPIFQKEFEVDGFILRVLPSNIRAIRLYLAVGFNISSLKSSIDVEKREFVISDLEMIYSDSPDFASLELDEIFGRKLNSNGG